MNPPPEPPWNEARLVCSEPGGIGAGGVGGEPGVTIIVEPGVVVVCVTPWLVMVKLWPNRKLAVVEPELTVTEAGTEADELLLEGPQGHVPVEEARPAHRVDTHAARGVARPCR